MAAWPVDHASAAVVASVVASAGDAVDVVDVVDVVETSGETDRIFPLASVTKLITATAVLVAVEEGSVALDDSAGPPGSTVRHLLAHASGLGPDDRQAALAQPATRRVYSNAGFELLADTVEGTTGLPFTTYATEAVLDPLEMRSTTIDGSPAYGARSTVGDLSRFAAELLAPTVLAPGTLSTATQVAFPGLAGVLPGYGRQDPNDWGLGFELRDGKQPHWTGSRNSPRTFGHFGRAGTFLWVDPDAGLACVVLTDREFGPWAIEAWPALSDAVLTAYSTQ